MSDDLLIERQGAVLRVVFNRPDQRNAMTWEMYDGIAEACDRAEADPGIRAMVLRGAGDRAFVAGTDIGQFTGFRSAEDGVAYEERMAAVLDRLEGVRVPTVAAVSGFCVGGGLALAACCDLRIATRDSRFGVPVARTLGNCLAMNTYSLLAFHLGPSRALDLLLRARLMDAEEARTAGFVAELCEDADALDAAVEQVTGTLAGHAPLTMWAAKEGMRRLRRSTVPDGEDIVREVWGSEDFRHGVQAFLAKRRPEWTGR